MQEEPWQKSKNWPVNRHLKQKYTDNRDLEVFCHFSAQLNWPVNGHLKQKTAVEDPVQKEQWQKSKNWPESSHLKQNPQDIRDLEVFCH